MNTSSINAGGAPGRCFDNISHKDTESTKKILAMALNFVVSLVRVERSCTTDLETQRPSSKFFVAFVSLWEPNLVKFLRPHWILAVFPMN